MKLKQEILDVLSKLGAEPYQIEALVAYFGNRLTEADSTVAATNANLESLQKQLEEATVHAKRVREGVQKFVDLV